MCSIEHVLFFQAFFSSGTKLYESWFTTSIRKYYSLTQLFTQSTLFALGSEHKSRVTGRSPDLFLALLKNVTQKLLRTFFTTSSN